MRKNILVIVFLFSVIFQSRNMFIPPFISYDWRQWDTYSVIRNFREEGMNIFTPRTNQIYVLEAGDSGRLFLLDFPLYEYISAIFSYFVDISPINLRIVNIVLGAVVSILLFKLLKHFKIEDKKAFFSVFLLNLSPLFQFSVISIQPDMLMFLMFLAALNQFLTSTNVNWVLIISLVVSILIKPYVLLIFAPLIIHNYLKTKKKQYIYLFLTFIPYFAWFLWGITTPAGEYWIQAQSWVLTSVNSWNFDLKIISLELIKRLFISTLTIPVIYLSFLGYKNIERSLKEKLNFIFLGFILFFVIFLPGNYNHTYYQLPLLAPFALLLAYGIKHLKQVWFLILFLPLSILPGIEMYKSLFRQHQIYLDLDNWQFNQTTIPRNTSVIYYNQENSPVLLNMMNVNGYIYPSGNNNTDCDEQKIKINFFLPSHLLVFNRFVDRQNEEKYSNMDNSTKCLSEFIHTPIYKENGIEIYKLNSY